MRMFVACCICVFACAANAESGFLRAVFTGSGYDGSSVVSLGNGATVVAEPTELYAGDCPEHTTYAFVTYMLMEPGETYYFKGVYDDYATLKIDDEWVLNQGEMCVEVTGSYKAANVMKWHRLDLRVANDSLDGGLTSSILNNKGYGGILFKKGEDGAWQRFGLNAGIDFRTTDGGRQIFWNNYAVNNGAMTGKLVFSYSDFENELLLATSRDSTNWSKMVVCTLSVREDEYDFNIPVDLDRPFVRFGTRQGTVENWSATLDLAKAKDPVMGEVAHDIILGEDDVTFSIPILGLGAGTKKAKVYVRYGIDGSDGFKKTQVATISSPGVVVRKLEDLIPEKDYRYSVIVQNSNGGYTESDVCHFKIERKWSYSISNGKATIQGVSPSTGEIILPATIEGYPVDDLGPYSWTMGTGWNCTSLFIPEGVRGVSYFEFSEVKEVTLPSSLRFLGKDEFAYYCDPRINYLGPYCGYTKTQIEKSTGFYSRDFGASWLDVIDISTFKGYWQTNLQNVVIVSTAMRKNDPTVMDVKFKVLSEKPTVKVRVLAFEDGERSFAKVVRPVTFIDGTESSIGDSIVANQEHQLSWRVSSDWKIDVAKVKFEVLAVEDDILPLELTTLPRIGEHPSIEYSWNVMEESRVLDALFWLYADGREGLVITDGVLKNGGTKLADGAKLNGYSTIAYVYEGMGYRVLAGEELEHVKNISRLKLSPNGFRQYAVKTLE